MSEDIKVTDGTILEALNDKVDIDFQNVPTNSVGFARCSTEVTNCITEIPQRIKYTLENGTLTIKAGSVIIVPYGTEDLTAQYPVGATFLNDNFKVYDIQFEDGKFFVWAEMQNDISQNNTTTSTSERNVCLRISNEDTEAQIQWNVYTSSADSLPSDTQAYAWYQTTNNKLVGTDGKHSIKVACMSLPICRVVADGTYIFGSVTQVFNGMGYIGSTVWVDKDVKCLIPNGRNEDGTLNNIEFTRHKLEIETTATTNKNMFGVIDEASNVWDGHQFIEAETQPADNMTYTFWYQPSTNILKWHTTETSGWKRTRAAVFARYIRTAGAISEFKPKYTFQTLDYNNKAQIGTWGLPSTKYIDLTLGASTSTYVAPANGYFYVNKMTSANGQYLTVGNNNTGIIIVVDKPYTSAWCTILMPALKGQSCYVTYTAGGKVNNFRFYYSEGEV